MTFHLITLFPKAFKSYLGESIVARAIREKKITVKFYNPRDFTVDKWAKSAKGGSPDRRSRYRDRVDHRPYGGGPGMVLEAPAFVKAIDAIHSNVLKNIRIGRGGKGRDRSKIRVVIFSAGGKLFTNVYAKNLSKKFTDLVLVCGRYEGIDARVKKIFKAEDLSVGPYILTGGELPAMIVLDAVSRQIEGVLGNFNSVEEHRTASSEVYTRPEIFSYKGKKYRVPKILLSGHHAKIEEWKKSR